MFCAWLVSFLSPKVEILGKQAVSFYIAVSQKVLPYKFKKSVLWPDYNLPGASNATVPEID